MQTVSELSFRFFQSIRIMKVAIGSGGINEPVHVHEWNPLMFGTGYLCQSDEMYKNHTFAQGSLMVLWQNVAILQERNLGFTNQHTHKNPSPKQKCVQCGQVTSPPPVFWTNFPPPLFSGAAGPQNCGDHPS